MDILEALKNLGSSAVKTIVSSNSFRVNPQQLDEGIKNLQSGFNNFLQTAPKPNFQVLPPVQPIRQPRFTPPQEASVDNFLSGLSKAIDPKMQSLTKGFQDFYKGAELTIKPGLDVFSKDFQSKLENFKRQATTPISESVYDKYPALNMFKSGNEAELVTSFYGGGVNKVGAKVLPKIASQIEQKLSEPLRNKVRLGSYTNVASLDNPLITKEGRERVAKISLDDYKEWTASLFDEIKALPPSHLTQKIDDFKDIPNVSKGFKDLYRNFETVFGARFPQVKKAILDPFNNAKAEFFQMQDNWLESLDKQVVKGLGIKKGSKESAAVQQFGEGLKDLPSLIKEFGETKANKIVEADKWFRASYDDLLNEVNRTRQSIYGQNGIIPKRQDYYRHFTEMAQGFRGLKNIFDTTANISSELAGISEFTKPRSKWLSFAQKRLGSYTEQDAVGGFLNYLKAASYAKTIDPQIGKFRQLAGELVTQTNETSGANMGKLNNFIEFLHDFSNDLAGKTNPLDRTAQKWVPGGRKTFKALNWLNSRVKANVILGNVSSSIAQIFSVPQGMANIQNPAIWAKGAGKTLASIFKPNQEMAQSTFIKERYFSSYDKFNTGMLETPKKFAVWMIQVLDEVGTKYIWNMHYLKALESGAKNPVSYADDMTKKLVGGRGIGEVPLAQKSKIFQLIAPFQLEVTNAWWVLKDFIDERAFGKIATLFVLNHVFNKGAEAIRGSGVVFDPIQATIDALGELDSEDGALKAGGRLAGEVLSNFPLGQTIAQVYPEYGMAGLPTRKEFFGGEDPTRFGGGGLLTKGLQDPIYKVLPPFGGQQIKRSIEGIQAAVKGYSTGSNGNVQFPIDQNPLNLVKSAVFGKNATPEAQQYFNTNARPLSAKQSDAFRASSDQSKYYQDLMQARRIDSTTSQAKGKTAIDITQSPGGTLQSLGQNAEKRKQQEEAISQLFAYYPDAEVRKELANMGVDYEQGRMIYLRGIPIPERAPYLKQSLKGLSNQDFTKVVIYLAENEILSESVINLWLDQGQITKDQKKMLNRVIDFTKGRADSPFESAAKPKQPKLLPVRAIGSSSVPKVSPITIKMPKLPNRIKDFTPLTVKKLEVGRFNYQK